MNEKEKSGGKEGRFYLSEMPGFTRHIHPASQHMPPDATCGQGYNNSVIISGGVDRHDINRIIMSRQNFHPFKVTGILAHQRPKKHLDLTRIIYARDAVHAAEIYQKRLRGVKKNMIVEVALVK